MGSRRLEGDDRLAVLSAEVAGACTDLSLERRRELPEWRKHEVLRPGSLDRQHVEVAGRSQPEPTIKEGADLVEREDNEKLLDVRAEGVAADLSEIEAEVRDDPVRGVLVALERHVSEAGLGVSLGVHVVVLHPTGCGDPHSLRLDERGESARHAKSTAGEVALR